jgi:putative DNA primase/helicase
LSATPATSGIRIPEIGPAEIRGHVELLHTLAAPLAGVGKLIIACFAQDPDQENPKTGKPGRPLPPTVVHIEIGDIGKNVRVLRGITQHMHYNVYMPLAVLRTDLELGRKGEENDIEGVLGFVADFDDVDARSWGSRLPVPPHYALETSTGRFQIFYFFERPETVAGAKAVAERLKAFARCDHGTADLSHVWRVPGSLNWPNARKIADGRSPEPQLVRIVKPWDGSKIPCAELAAALTDPEPHFCRQEHRPPNSAVSRESTKATEISAAQASIELIMRLLPAQLRARITETHSGDRSRALFFVINALIERGLDDATIERILCAHPNGIASKYAERTDLAKEVARIRSKSSNPALVAGDERPGDLDENRPLKFTDDALATRFVSRFGQEMRYVARWNRWMVWDGCRWAEDQTLLSFDRSRGICREASEECRPHGIRLASAIASAKTVAAVERLAKADQTIAAIVDQWDQHAWFLNTPAGIIDLRTGQLHRHDPKQYHTKMTAVGPGGDCPTWLTFLDRVTAGNRELQLFLQRMTGYVLTGLTFEHALFFLYGTGGNGKGVFLNTVSGVLGDYATTAPMETFTASANDRHPTELAGLRGARLVTAQETEEGRRWAESRIKALTGGDKIPVRFMRQDYWEMTPVFKLVIAGNHKPALRNVDEAIRRRMNLIPFTVTIPKEERDRQLVNKLQQEWPGILRWAIDGCIEWQATGLAPPEPVSAATTQYLEAEDSLALWIAECCAISNSHEAATAELFGSWKAWAERSGEPSGSMKRFSQLLQARGFQPKRIGHAGKAGFAGITLLQREMSDEHWNR